MRVLLINPRVPFEADPSAPILPPLGLMYLVAATRERRPGKDSFQLVDEGLNRPQSSEIEHYEDVIRSFEPDLIGFSVLTAEAGRLAELVKGLKSRFPEIKMVAGGPHATAYGRILFEQAPLDYVVRGEGEVVFVSLLDALERGENDTGVQVPGVVQRLADGSIRETEAACQLEDLDELPIPAWDLVDFAGYATQKRFTSTGRERYATLFTSRGCPYRCTYCHHIFGKGFRGMSAERVVSEIEHLQREYGVEEFFIIDDIFNFDRRRVSEICALIRERQLEVEISFPNGLRVDRLNRDLIADLASVGTYHVAVAVESATPRLQALVKKMNHLGLLKKNLHFLVQHRVFTTGFFMIGFPTETRWEILRTILYACRSKLHAALFFIVVPFAGTEMAETFVGEDGSGAEASATGDYLYTSSDLSKISSIELNFLQRLAFVLFYSNPMRIWRIVRDYPGGRVELFLRGLRRLRYVSYESLWRMFKRKFKVNPAGSL